MSNVKSFVDSIVMLASQAGARDNGTRLMTVDKTIRDCLQQGNSLDSQLDLLNQLKSGVETALKIDDSVFLGEVVDMIDTKARHLRDAGA
jgi:hypothetical protein